MDGLTIAVLGAVGGLVPDILRIIELRHQTAPDYLSRGFFWFSLSLLSCVGAFTAYMLSPVRAIDALAIGFSAPTLLSNLLQKGDAKPVRPARKAPRQRPLPRPFPSRDSSIGDGGASDPWSGGDPWSSAGGGGPMGGASGQRPPDLEARFEEGRHSSPLLSDVRRWWAGESE
jgi:hypothetical protein